MPNIITAAASAALIAAGSLLGAAPASAAPSPYSSDGTWLVPSEIAPGTYRTALASGESMGYYATCADFACEIGTPGFITNDNLRGPGIVVVPPNAVSIELRGLVLTRMGVGSAAG